MNGLVGSNDCLNHLRANPTRFILKTHTRRGVVYAYSDTMRPIAAEVVERLIAKGRLVPREASGQGFELAEDAR